jgi:catechol 2,3-dioxygenase-like lactoylglutathione lyase family enzyme
VTGSETAAPTNAAEKAVALQMGEVVLKTGRFEAMHAWYSHLLGHGPFFERTPDPDAPPRPAGMPERAVDVRVAFFLVHENGHPHHQVIGLFGMESLRGTPAGGPGLHHFQFGTDSLEDLFAQYEWMKTFGVHPYRTANHGQATSFYFQDPDGNVIEFTTSNFPTFEEELAFMASPAFAANPSGVELDAEEFAARYHAGEPRAELLSLVPRGGRR